MYFTFYKNVLHRSTKIVHVMVSFYKYINDVTGLYYFLLHLLLKGSGWLSDEGR